MTYIPSPIAVSPAAHQGWGWQPPAHHAHLASLTWLPVTTLEMAHLGHAFAMAFVSSTHPNTDHQPAQLVALLGLRPNENLWVAPDGRWLASQKPLALAAYPFSLQATHDPGQPLLCVDQNSPCLNPSQGPRLPFFNEQGQPSPALQQVIALIQRVHQGLMAAGRAVQALQSAALLTPWPLKLDIEGQVHEVKGLLRIDEARLMSMPADELGALRDTGALTMAYAQLMSMHQIKTLGELARDRWAEAAAQAAAAASRVDASGDTLRFS